MFNTHFLTEFSGQKTLAVIVMVALLACLDIVGRRKGRKTHFAFGVVIGSVLSAGLIRMGNALLTSGLQQNGYVLGLGIVLLAAVWSMLFGRWQAHTKATVLGTFLFWILLHMLSKESPDARLAHMIAIGVAAIPAGLWCAIFLPYHQERLSVVLTLFFAGAMSTVPILFYDALVRRGATLDFFLFRIETQSFGSSAHSFVGNLWPGMAPVGVSVVSTMVMFLLVGFIEEGSKIWVLLKSGKQYISSIDDMMQMAIVVGIGFAFAENITPTGYFVNFVKQYLMGPGGRDWMAFVGNVTGRSVLTSMVHIVSTGTAGYFLGLATFASPLLKEDEQAGRTHPLLRALHRVFGTRESDIFRREMILIGFVAALVLHGTCNFLVTIPDILPGNPHTLGDLLKSPAGSPMHLFSLLLVPTLLYVVGGFILLTTLFNRKTNAKERGHVVEIETLTLAEEE